MADGAEKAPLTNQTKDVSLRFPDGAVGPVGGDTGGIFDGNDSKSEPFSYLTRRDDYEPPIPEPPQREIEQAARLGVDKNTGLTTQPEWLSVLKKRQGPWFFVRWLLCNCACNPRFTMTRAQWIWFANLGALAGHAYYAIIIWMESRPKGAMNEVTVWRLQPSYNETATDHMTAVLVNNLKPIRFDIVVGGFFFISALAHLVIVAVGPFDRFIWAFWRQLDLCFHWWRWLNYMVSLPLMIMAICCITNLRVENEIALCWSAMATTATCFFLVEMWSRPHRNADRSYDMSRWLGDEKPVKPGLPWTRLAPDEVCQRALQQSRRRMNYVIRMLPLVVGIFPFVAMWVVILNHFFTQLGDLRVDAADDLYARVPDWVPWCVLGTLFFTFLYFLPLLWWQWAPPRYYWKTDIVYTALDLGAKIFLGVFLYHSVILKDSYNIATLLDQNATLADA